MREVLLFLTPQICSASLLHGSHVAVHLPVSDVQNHQCVFAVGRIVGEGQRAVDVSGKLVVFPFSSTTSTSRFMSLIRAPYREPERRRQLRQSPLIHVKLTSGSGLCRAGVPPPFRCSVPARWSRSRCSSTVGVGGRRRVGSRRAMAHARRSCGLPRCAGSWHR